MKIALLNTTIATTDGIYEVKTIDLETAKKLIQGQELDSAIGHESTAQIMTELLGVPVAVNRQMFAHEEGQTAIVFKLKGRPPEGKIFNRDEIEAIGYEFKTMIRLKEVVTLSQKEYESLMFWSGKGHACDHVLGGDDWDCDDDED